MNQINVLFVVFWLKGTQSHLQTIPNIMKFGIDEQ